MNLRRTRCWRCAVPRDAYTVEPKKYYKWARTLYYLSPKPPLGISPGKGHKGKAGCGSDGVDRQNGYLEAKLMQRKVSWDQC